MSRLLIYSDGGCNQTGAYGSYAAYGFAAEEAFPGTEEEHIRLHSEKQPIVFNSRFPIVLSGFRPTNNMAEAATLLSALTWLCTNRTFSKKDSFLLCLDSELVINQMLGVYRVSNTTLKRLYTSIHTLLGRSEQKTGFSIEKLISFKHIPGVLMKQLIIGH